MEVVGEEEEPQALPATVLSNSLKVLRKSLTSLLLCTDGKVNDRQCSTSHGWASWTSFQFANQSLQQFVWSDVCEVSQGNRTDTRNNSILHYMHQMLVLAFRVVEDGDKVQMSARGTLLPSQAIPKYSPTGGTSKHVICLAAPKYGSTEVCTVRKSLPVYSRAKLSRSLCCGEEAEVTTVCGCAPYYVVRRFCDICSRICRARYF